MNTHGYRVEQTPLEHIVLPSMPSDTDDIEVVEFEVEEIVLGDQDWVPPLIH